MGTYVAGMEAVWAAWLGGLLVLGAGTALALRQGRWPSWRTLHNDEQGISYTLPYILVIPFYLFLACLVFEATFLIVAKIGTLYAAHAAARSAVVWESAKPASLRQERIEQAAFTALAPFASAAKAGDFAGGSPPGQANDQARQFAGAYQLYSAGSAGQRPPLNRPYPRSNAPNDFLIRKYLNAAARTRVDVKIDGSRPDGEVTVKITYRARLFIPGPARLFATNNSWPAERRITSTATLVNEAPVSADGTLGIDYQSR